MTIILAVAPELRHQLAEREWHDRRLAWTVCGLLFAWGHVELGQEERRDCGRCWS